MIFIIYETIRFCQFHESKSVLQINGRKQSFKRRILVHKTWRGNMHTPKMQSNARKFNLDTTH